jgi:hypothetical protein
LGHSRVAQITHQLIALGIDVGPDMTGDLPRVMAQTNPAVERDRAEPDRTAIGAFLKDPATDARDVACRRFCRPASRKRVVPSSLHKTEG